MASTQSQTETTTTHKDFSMGQSAITTNIAISAATVCTANDMRRCISDGLVLKGRTVLGTLLDQSTVIAIDDVNVPLNCQQEQQPSTASPYETIRQVNTL
jgi:hypothetical protein